ncbi:E3 SUMO- ligase KIAA1586-like [Paramuricea clavata]|uniref:E3 SUMO- ligase KIAA1586-like n=1 Tax=Paramuricea clavata TaxID=317549 RepID=A0A7D9IEF8_PARCT|nr:E3 SUMO- ligase KIAA1586-like [Paramuricea clavata]
MSATTGSIAQLMRQTTNSDATTSMEIKLCAFITQHNLPLSITEDIVELLRSLFPNDAALSYLKLGKQKATNIVRQVLGFDYLKEMVALLRSRKFSVIIDEATDKSVKKQLVIIATFFDIEKFEVQYWLADMIETEDGSATGIYATMKEAFLQHNIPMRNIIGYSSGTTNVMFGQYNSVSQLLKSEFSYVQLVKGSCHLIHLVSSHTALKLPKGVDDLCRDVYAHFSRSSKRQDVYKEFQAFFNAQPLKILSPAQTRWLSLQECVNRLLEQFEALIDPLLHLDCQRRPITPKRSHFGIITESFYPGVSGVLKLSTRAS